MQMDDEIISAPKSLFDLPPELHGEVAKYLHLLDVFRLRRLCRAAPRVFIPLFNDTLGRVVAKAHKPWLFLQFIEELGNSGEHVDEFRAGRMLFHAGVAPHSFAASRIMNFFSTKHTELSSVGRSRGEFLRGIGATLAEIKLFYEALTTERTDDWNRDGPKMLSAFLETALKDETGSKDGEDIAHEAAVEIALSFDLLLGWSVIGQLEAWQHC